MRLKNKIAIITGAGKGIGKGIAVRYAQEGAKVVLAEINFESALVVAEEIKKMGGEALALKTDVSSSKDTEEMARKTVEKYGRLDIMVNNAGISQVFPSVDLTPDDWGRAVKIDLFGVFYGCQCAAKQMISQGDGGCIINVTSIYGIVAAPMRAAYCTSKAGANMLTKLLASEWADKKIRVNAIAPGYIRTEFVQEIIDKGMLPVGAIEKRTPQGCMGEVKDVVGAAVYLASDEASFVTGSILTVDGGWTAYGYL